MPLALRPAEVTDFDGIVACLSRNGMSIWTRERWLSLFDDHPHRRDFEGIPRGYVLESDGEIVGSITNVWAKYALGQRELKAIRAGNAAVDTAHRAGSIKLFGEQLLQPGVDLYLNGSAAAATSKIMETLKVPRVPQPDNDLTLLWAARGIHVARAGLRRKRIPLAAIVGVPVGVGFRIASGFKLWRGAPRGHLVSNAAEFSAEFDDLWSTLRDRTTKLIAFRDAATLRWRYDSLLAAGDAALLTVRRDGRLAGYAVLVRTRRPGLGLVTYTIHDLQCADDDPALVGSLVAAAYRRTRADGLDLLEWAGFSGQKRAVAERASLLRYRLDVWQAFYYSRDRALKQELAAPDRWEFSSFDSD